MGLSEPDFQAFLEAHGTVEFLHPQLFWNADFDSYMVKKAMQLGAIEEKPLGPKGGKRWRIVSPEAWERVAAWRAALALGARGMRVSRDD